MLLILLCLHLHLHPEFTDECILGNPDVEFYFLGLIHPIGHAAGDEGGGVATADGAVDVEAVDVPVVLRKYDRKHFTTSSNMTTSFSDQRSD